jgi:hypothetical protein
MIHVMKRLNHFLDSGVSLFFRKSSKKSDILNGEIAGKRHDDHVNYT